MAEIQLGVELQYVLVIFGMFIVSRYLQRFKLPSAITCLGLGVFFGLGLGIFQDEGTVKVLAVLGIVALFLFAGMEIEFRELRRAWSIILQHILVQTLLLGVSAWFFRELLGLETRPALIAALAVMTPSTGFILDSLPGLPVNEGERFWIKSKAIATEIVALVILFFSLQSAAPAKMITSIGIMAAMIVLLPFLFKVFAAKILPYAPKTEFAFLLIIALICAAVTKKLGVYYLLGAFIVGIVQQRVRTKVPALDSPNLLHAVEFFAGFFVPFYFFKAGLALRLENFSMEALKLGVILLASVLPFRVLSVAVHRKLVLGEKLTSAVRTGTALLPTLVFTLVLAEILRDHFAVRPEIIGGLVVFTIVNTMVPAFLLRESPPESPDGIQ